MLQEELISILPNLLCVSLPIFLNGAVKNCQNGIPFPFQGYHIREAGSTAVQEIAFTLSNGKAYVKAALEKGLRYKCFWQKTFFLFQCA